MNTIDKMRLVWVGVYFTTPKSTDTEEKPVSVLPPKLYRKSIYRSTTNRTHKYLIHTSVPFKPNRMFQMKQTKVILSRMSQSNIDESFSAPSISSYGMLEYENHISSRASSGVNPPSIKIPTIPATPTSKCLSRVIQNELNEKPNIGTILEGYVNQIILKKRPPKDPIFAKQMSDIYRLCIDSSPILKRLARKDNTFIPENLQEIIKNYALAKASVKVPEDINDYTFLYVSQQAPETVNYEINGPKYTYSSTNDVSAELMKDNDEFKRFYQAVLLTKTFSIRPNEEFIEMKNLEKVVEIIDDLSSELMNDSDIPDAKSRRSLLVILKSAKENIVLLKELSLKVELWFEGLLLGLYSKYRTVVEDTCLIISFICFQPILAQTLINNSQFDVARDIVSALIKAMESKPYWFWIYNYPLGYIIGCCQQFSILEVIIDKVIQSKQPVILFYWPHFIFYATKFWQTNNLTFKHSIIVKIIQFLEHCIIKRLSIGPAKRALINFCRRCSIICKLLTVWPSHTNM